MLTYSPQLFWQLGGRGIRLDRQNTDKQTELVTFLPKHLYDAETQEEFDNKRLPLSFGAFLDRSKIEHQVSWINRERKNIKKLVPSSVNINQEFDLNELSEKDFLTMGEMSTYLHQINAYGAFQGRPEKIAEMILASPHYITINSLMFMVRTK